jgi:hypothetical protein
MDGRKLVWIEGVRKGWMEGSLFGLREGVKWMEWSMLGWSESVRYI